MKRTLKLMLVMVGLITGLGTACSAAGVYDSFESGLGSGWSVGSGTAPSNPATYKRTGDGALYVPVTGEATNSSTMPDATKVWTDFYTIPRMYLSATSSVPDIDVTATAQFFVNTNGMWVAFSGNGSGGYLTNILTASLVPGLAYPAVTQFTDLYHVSVMHNYVTKKWSLLVNDVPLATNLHFIASGAASHAWFQMRNLGGSAVNVCWLDDFLVTNRAPVAGQPNALTNLIPGTTIPMSQALQAFGSITDPRPTNQTVGVAGAGIALEFGRTVGDGRQYVVMGANNHTLSGAASNGVVAAGAFTDNDVLAGAATKYFYQLLTIAPDGSMTVTNDETYAAFKQSRAQSRAYIVGAPLDIRDGNRRVDGTLGDMLASGLSADDTMTIYVVGVEHTYTLDGGGNWTGDDGSLAIAPGQGVLIRRLATAPATSSAYLVGTVPTNTASAVTIGPGWSIVAWPYPTSGTLAEFGGLTAESGAVVKDFIYLQNQTTDVTLARFTLTGWKTGFRVGGGQAFNPTLQPGAGILINHIGADADWTP